MQALASDQVPPGAHTRRDATIALFVVALVTCLVSLGIAADHVWRQTHDPDGYALAKCGSKAGVVAQTAQFSACYEDAIEDGPWDTAATWFIVAAIGAAVSIGCLAVGVATLKPRQSTAR